MFEGRSPTAQKEQVTSGLWRREIGSIPREALMQQLHFPVSAAKLLVKQTELRGHEGCVNRIAWNEDGSQLVSGSDDRRLIIWNFPDTSIAPLAVNTQHTANIFGVRFLPCTGGTKLVSGAMDNLVQFHSLHPADSTRPATATPATRDSSGAPRNGYTPSSPSSSHTRTAMPLTVSYGCHKSRVKEVEVEPMNPFNFWSAGEDGCIRQFDTRIDARSQGSYESPNVLVNLRYAGKKVEAKSLDINRRSPHLMVVACGDPELRVFDRRKLSLEGPVRNQNGTKPVLSLVPLHLQKGCGKSVHSTYANFSNKGDKVVATYHTDQAYSFDIRGAGSQTTTYRGLRNGSSSPASAPSASSSRAPSVQAMPRGSAGGQPGGGDARAEAGRSTRHLSASTSNAHAACEEGNALVVEERWHAAVGSFSIAIYLAPVEAKYYVRRAQAFLGRGWGGDELWALQDCDTATSLDPMNGEAYMRRIHALRDLGQLKCALAVAESFKHQFPDQLAEEFDCLTQMLRTSLVERRTNYELKKKRMRESREESRRRRQALHRRSLGSGGGGGGGGGSLGNPEAEMRTETGLRTQPSGDSATNALVAARSALLAAPRPPAAAQANTDLPSAPALRTVDAQGSACAAAHLGTAKHDEVESEGAEGVEEEGDGGEDSPGTSSAAPAAHLGAAKHDEAESMGAEGVEVKGDEGRDGPGRTSAAPVDGTIVPPPLERHGELEIGGMIEGAVVEEEEVEDEVVDVGLEIDGAIEGALVEEEEAEDEVVDAWLRSRFGVVSASASSCEGDDDEENDEDAEDNPDREPFLNYFIKSYSTAGESSQANDDASPIKWGGLPLGVSAPVQRYVGHCNRHTDIKECVYVGMGDLLIAAGSDDGRVFLYDAETGELLAALEADADVANCVQCHPFTATLATSGIEDVIRLWSPTAESTVERGDLQQVVTKNQERMNARSEIMRMNVLRQLLRTRLQGGNQPLGEGGLASDDDEEEEDGGCRVN
eukprot:gene8194-1456_t